MKYLHMSIKILAFLKCSQNETSCGQNLLSCEFEISNRFEFISPPMWTYSEFHPARSHVNADNEITSHRSEILSRSKMLKFLRFLTCVSWGIFPAQILLIVQTTAIRHSIFYFSSFSIFLQSRISESVICSFCSFLWPFLLSIFSILFLSTLLSIPCSVFSLSLFTIFSDLPYCFLFKPVILSFLFSYYSILSASPWYSITIQSVLFLLVFIFLDPPI